MVIIQLIYMSSLIADDAVLLREILDTSVRNNKRRSITGMMLYADGNVMQVLEGPRDMVLETFSAIQRDDRHRGIFVMIEEEIAARQFASWSMGFRQLSEAELDKYPMAAHIFNARQDEIALRVRSGDALTVLKSFADGTMG